MSMLRKRSPVVVPVEDAPPDEPEATFVHGPAPTFRVFERKPAPLVPIYAHRRIDGGDYRADVGMASPEAAGKRLHGILKAGRYSQGEGVMFDIEPEPATSPNPKPSRKPRTRKTAAA